MSPISSRKSVPRSAASKRPTLRATAPVKAPLSWPKSSLSSNPRGIAAQFSFTKGRSACAVLVNRAGDEFLPRAGFPFNQSSRIRRRDCANEVQYLSESLACSDDVFKAVVHTFSAGETGLDIIFIF